VAVELELLQPAAAKAVIVMAAAAMRRAAAGLRGMGVSR